MKKIILAFIFFGVLKVNVVKAQEYGLSFSYFFPKHGEACIPISPFSIRGVRLFKQQRWAIETGATAYYISGLPMSGLPFSSTKPMMGSHIKLYIPLYLAITSRIQKSKIVWRAGGFGIYGIFQKLNMGNIDRAIQAAGNWDVVNADFSFKNKPGGGLFGGIEFVIPWDRKTKLTFGFNYLYGYSRLPIQGSYTAVKNNQTTTTQVEYSNAQVDFTGIEISLGVLFSQ